MERLKHVKDTLLCAVESQLGDLANVDAKELGEVVDMVKDMEEAIYYCSITKAMKEKEEEEEHYKHMSKYRDMDKEEGRMYFNERWPYHREVMKGDMRRRPVRDREEEEYEDSMWRGREGGYPMEVRDAREGKSPVSRKNYMEAKELHQGVPAQMKELEKYLQELSQDITEMIADASPEEKAVLQQKLSILASKIK